MAVFGLPPTLTLSSQAKHVQESFWGEIYGGYGHTFFSNLYVGIRVGANFSDTNIKSQSSSNLSQILAPNIPISSTITNYPKAKLWFPEPTFIEKVGWVFYEKTLVFGLVGLAINRPLLEGSVIASDSGGGNTPFDGEVNFSIRKKSQVLHF